MVKNNFTKGKLEREISAGGVVFRRSHNKVLILLLKNNKGWVLPKGKIDPGEDLEMTALREVREETGLTNLKTLNKLGQENYFYRSFGKDKRLIYKTVYYFLIENEKGKPFPQKEEGFIGAKWFGLEDAMEGILYKQSKKILKKAINEIENE